jgi:hypothetical protein
MVRVEIRAPTLVEDLADYLTYKLNGSVVSRQGELYISFREPLSTDRELRLVERMVWAWRTERQIAAPATVTHLVEGPS